VKVSVKRSSSIERTARLTQLEGMFDIPPRQREDLEWDVDLPIESREWNVGLIVGPSGCGKSTIARELFPDAYMRGFEWPASRSVIDGFPTVASIKDVTAMLSSVGFSSPPSWTRPFGVLSNGEQFRATLARALIECPELCVFDEFTSVVDRTVGKIGSAAVAKTVRRRKQKFIAVTCHDDVIDWLDPDWIYFPATATFDWRLVRRRPAIELDIRRVHNSAWKHFSRHHYLTASLHKGAVCFCAFVDGKPVGFHSYLPFVGRLKGKQTAVRGHRSVVLPDYQGVGIGNAMITNLAGMWRAIDKRVFRNTGHPAEIAGALRDPNWKLIRAPSRSNRGGGKLSQLSAARAADRLTASFEYVGPAMQAELAQSLASERV
jgi:ABC-type thiamine transport system ATPase subunit/GNAT superfamily N-acetyltransferase